MAIAYNNIADVLLYVKLENSFSYSVPVKLSNN